MKYFKNTIEKIISHKYLLSVIIGALIITLFPFIFDGQYGCVNDVCGFIVGTNYRDGLWFQAVATTSFKTFPFQLPNFAGVALSGYHYLPNLMAYALTFIGIPVALTYYKLIPIAYFLGLTGLLVHMGKRIVNSPLYVGILMFLTYFGMHLSLITSLFHSGTIKNQVLINTFQATRILESPHTAIAMLILYTCIILLAHKKVRLLHRVIIGLLLFLALGTKVYVAFALGVMLFAYELLSLIRSNKIKPFILHGLIYALFGLSAVLIFYNPLSHADTSSTFIFSPFSTVHHLIETPDLFYSESLVLARYYLYEHGWSPRLILIELYSSALFFLFYFGTRIIGIFQIGIQILRRNMSLLESSIVCSIGVSMMMSILFIQKGDWFNPIQFAVPAAFLMNIFAAKFLFQMIQNNKYIGYVSLGVIVLLTVPANVVNLSYLSNPGRFVIPQKEVDALEYLKSQKDGVVYAPIDENDMAYVSALTGKPTYLNFLSVLGNSGQDVQNRQELSQEPTRLIKKEQIQYWYLPKNTKDYSKLYPLCSPSEGLEVIFENEAVAICTRKAN